MEIFSSRETIKSTHPDGNQDIAALLSIKRTQSRCTIKAINQYRLRRNFEDFVEKIERIRAKSDDLLVSSDVTSLFISVPVDEALEELRNCLQQRVLDQELV